MIQLENLKEIVFGKKKSKDNDKDKGDDIGSKGNENPDRKIRDGKSYRRPAPNENEITDTQEYKINDCPECGTALTKKEIIVRYIEDIQLVINETIGDIKRIKKITKQVIEKGYCPHCKKWFSAIPISSQAVMIGFNARQFIAYATNALRLTYEQTRNILKDLYGFEISDGEIANILEEISQRLHPEFERIKQRISKALSVHIDETGWQTGKENNYAWVLVSGETEEAIFSIGKTRGKGNAENLLKDCKGVRISDCYSAYKNIAGAHQVCWAHIIRKVRELAKSDILEKEKKEFSKEIYFDLQELFKGINNVLKEEFNKNKRLKILPEFYEKLEAVIKKIKISKIQIEKLTDVAGTMERYKKELFTYITHKGVAPILIFNFCPAFMHDLGISF